MCRLVLCHMNHLFCAVQTKEAMNKYLHSRLNGSQGGGLTALLPSEALYFFHGDIQVLNCLSSAHKSSPLNLCNSVNSQAHSCSPTTLSQTEAWINDSFLWSLNNGSVMFCLRFFDISTKGLSTVLHTSLRAKDGEKSEP